MVVKPVSRTSTLYNILRPPVRLTRSWSGCNAHFHPIRTFATSSPAQDAVRLAYDLWGPPSRPSETRTLGNPIVFAHGLFGSKKNNRSMSKVLARELHRPVYAIVSASFPHIATIPSHSLVACKAPPRSDSPAGLAEPRRLTAPHTPRLFRTRRGH